MMLDLDEEEVRAVEKIRKRREEIAVERAKIALCAHKERRYSGHSHNDDAYKCVQCGHIEWR
jgi:hypothetical protein